jgi:hypothetical protein
MEVDTSLCGEKRDGSANDQNQTSNKIVEVHAGLRRASRGHDMGGLTFEFTRGRRLAKPAVAVGCNEGLDRTTA